MPEGFDVSEDGTRFSSGGDDFDVEEWYRQRLEENKSEDSPIGSMRCMVL